MINHLISSCYTAETALEVAAFKLRQIFYLPIDVEPGKFAPEERLVNYSEEGQEFIARLRNITTLFSILIENIEDFLRISEEDS